MEVNAQYRFISVLTFTTYESHTFIIKKKKEKKTSEKIQMFAASNMSNVMMYMKQVPGGIA